MVSWPEIKAGIFAGESGGDYNALFGYANRPGGPFAGHNVTDMTVDQAIDFANPSGPYAQYVKGKLGRVATPMGAFQVVGNTLAQAKRWAGLTGNEQMTPEVQDRIGQVILANQGTGAWAGYRGPRDPASVKAPAPGVTDGPKGQETYTPKDASQPASQYALPRDNKPPETFAQRLGDSLGDLGSASFGGQQEMPRSTIPNQPAAARMASAPIAPIDPQQAEAQRQMLALAMQRLNSGSLF